MSPTQSYFFSIIAIICGLFYITYVIYGRLRGKPLFGHIKQKSPEHAAFLKLINNKKLMILVTVGVLFATVNAVFDALKILEQYDGVHSILIVAPIAVITVFVLVALAVPNVSKK